MLFHPLILVTAELYLNLSHSYCRKTHAQTTMHVFYQSRPQKVSHFREPIRYIWGWFDKVRQLISLITNEKHRIENPRVGGTEIGILAILYALFRDWRFGVLCLVGLSIGFWWDWRYCDWFCGKRFVSQFFWWFDDLSRSTFFRRRLDPIKW